MTEGESIFWRNADLILRDIGMQHLDPVHGAAVNVVRRCLNVRARPEDHHQAFLENESPPLLAYLEQLGSSGDAAAWRTLEQRIRLRLEVLRETGMQPCARPWLSAIWHSLPELAGIGQSILDRQGEENAPAPAPAAGATETTGGAGSGEGDKGSSGKEGSAGATSKPRPASRLALPAVTVELTDREKKVLADKEKSDDAKQDAAPEGPDGTDGDGGTSGPPGGRGGRR